MFIDTDRFREIIDTLSRNKSRSLLTGFGVFWGIFMLVFLIGGGHGMQDMLRNNFQGFATNSALVYAQPTTKPYAGFRKGRVWNMTTADITLLRRRIPQLDVITPMASRWNVNATHADKKTSVVFKGLLPAYRHVEEPRMRYGRYINDMDISHDRKVCVIGKKVYKDLFPGGGDPCGQRICVDKVYYQVVGVDYNTGTMHINGSAEESIVVPFSLMQRVYSLGDNIGLICVTARPGIAMADITQSIRQVIADNHHVDPHDEKSINVFNTEVMFGMLDNLFNGVNFLILLVGIGTLLAGSIGVSNIMMVTVRERTSEIGIRRAIGATPKDIMRQIIAESLTLTALAGAGGIMLAVAILEMMELGSTVDGVATAVFQIRFHAAVGALLLLCLLGTVAGLIPAFKAMSIKPVDAMRDE